MDKFQTLKAQERIATCVRCGRLRIYGDGMPFVKKHCRACAEFLDGTSSHDPLRIPSHDDLLRMIREL